MYSIWDCPWKAFGNFSWSRMLQLGSSPEWVVRTISVQSWPIYMDSKPVSKHNSRSWSWPGPRIFWRTTCSFTNLLNLYAEPLSIQPLSRPCFRCSHLFRLARWQLGRRPSQLWYESSETLSPDRLTCPFLLLSSANRWRLFCLFHLTYRWWSLLPAQCFRVYLAGVFFVYFCVYFSFDFNCFNDVFLLALLFFRCKFIMHVFKLLTTLVAPKVRVYIL